MRVRVENTDASRSVAVVVRLRDASGAMVPELPAEAAPKLLPGASCDVWLHNGKDCVLVEL